jgi:hypothetical protein
MRNPSLTAVILLASCVRSPDPSQLKEDPSIVFPKFYARAPIMTSEQGVPYHLDGPTLVAIATAANDFAPKERLDTPCWDRQEAFHYQFIRQGDVIFVRIDHNTSYCGYKFLIMDGGAQYAISLDGRILRRVFDGEPSGPLPPPSPDAGGKGASGLQQIPEFSPGEPDPSFLELVRKKAESMRPDAGPRSPLAPDGGSPPPEDGGSSAARVEQGQGEATAVIEP